MTPETHRFADDGAIPNSPLAVALPQTDPVLGPDGPLVELWR
jgi:uncharacterized protein YjlB